jgi:hypothetical protein
MLCRIELPTNARNAVEQLSLILVRHRRFDVARRKTLAIIFRNGYNLRRFGNL